MKAQDHNKLLGIAFLVTGGLHLLSLLSTLITLPMLLSDASSPFRADPTVMRIFTIVMYVALGLNLFQGLLDSIAGFGILKRKQWGRVMGMVAAVPSLLGIPLGTALGVYALWFMTSDRGKNFYLGLGEGEQYLPPPPPQTWQQQG
jgi:hypothetical protein